MRRVLRDTNQQQKFERDGVVQIDLLSPEEVNEVKKLVIQVEAKGKDKAFKVDSSYKLSFFNSDFEYKQEVFNTITDYFLDRVNVHLEGYKTLIINIFHKEPGKGEVPVHQNWTFVDESKFASVSVWIPLVEVSRENGTLEFVKGSHQVLTPYRSPTIPWVFQDLIDPLKTKYLEPIELVPGQAAILDDSIIHWSSENNTEETRSAIQLIMYPDGATPLHYHYDGEGHLEVYEVTPEFFMDFNMSERPQNMKMIDKIPFTPFSYTEEEMMEKIQEHQAMTSI